MEGLTHLWVLLPHLLSHKLREAEESRQRALGLGPVGLVCEAGLGRKAFHVRDKIVEFRGVEPAVDVVTEKRCAHKHSNKAVR